MRLLADHVTLHCLLWWGFVSQNVLFCFFDFSSVCKCCVFGLSRGPPNIYFAAIGGLLPCKYGVQIITFVDCCSCCRNVLCPQQTNECSRHTKDRSLYLKQYVRKIGAVNAFWYHYTTLCPEVVTENNWGTGPTNPKALCKKDGSYQNLFQAFAPAAKASFP